MSTSFPNATQEFKHWEDLTATQLNAYVQYINYLNQGQWAQARNVFQSGGLSENMWPTEDDFNKMCDTILECKALYEAEDTSAKGIQDFMAQFAYRGIWNANNISQYKKFSIVRYSDPNYGTYLYMAISDVTTTTNPWSNSTSNNPQWARIVPASYSNSTSTFKGLWSGVVNYVVGDVVFYNNIMWSALNNNTNSAPTSTSVNWQLILDFNEYMAQYTTTQPTNMMTGSIWFKKLS